MDLRAMAVVMAAITVASGNCRLRVPTDVARADATFLRVDELVEGLVSAGANELERIAFETTKVKEVRAEARRMAMTAALEKAQNYCMAGGVGLGRILHIEDVNPLAFEGGMPRSGHIAGTNINEYDGDVRAFDPSLIDVVAAVFVSYEIKEMSVAGDKPRLAK